MLNDFFRRPKDMTKEWKIAFLVDKAGNRIAFHYNKVPASQVSRMSMIQGVFFTKDQSMILTTSPVAFSHDSKIVLEDGFQYSFVSETSADSDNENNPLGVNGTPSKRYITLEKMR